MTDTTTLNARFALPGLLRFGTGAHGALVAQLTAPAAEAEIAIQGAQLLTWTPAGQAPVVWLSPAARFATGKSLRGGAPVCWPWFGAHADDTSKPAHGFARNHDWQVLETGVVSGAPRITLGYTPGAAQQALWPHQAELHLTVTVGAQLELALITRNSGASAFTLTQALHTYFHVGDIAQARVEGLAGKPYIDKLQQDARLVQSGDIQIDREVDRIYLDCPEDAVIVDEALKRRIRVRKTGSRSCVVWNPWIDKAAKLGDLGEDGYRRMLCVETTNAADDAVTLAPGASHTLGTVISVE
jgi:D-hexose-6-phosphate mutarotase